jgi:hypothetical protein
MVQTAATVLWIVSVTMHRDMNLPFRLTTRPGLSVQDRLEPHSLRSWDPPCSATGQARGPGQPGARMGWCLGRAASWPDGQPGQAAQGR